MSAVEETQPVVKKVVRTRKVVKKTENLPVPMSRNTIRLRGVTKSYIQDKRFAINHDLAKVNYVLKNGKEITTTFSQQLPEQGYHDLQTYLKSEDDTCFNLQHSTTLFTQGDLDLVLLYDTEGKVIFVQEYTNSAF